MSLVTSQRDELQKLSILYERGSLKKIAIQINEKKNSKTK